MMRRREVEIGDLILWLAERSRGFTEPKLVVIGGYALRAFVPFSRYSRDCDFVLPRGLEVVRGWKPKDVTEETSERNEGWAFLRWSRTFTLNRQAIQLGADFMEGQVHSRDGEVFNIDDGFVDRCRTTAIHVAGKACEILVPSYADFFVLKVNSARKSDVRDIAALVWKNGVPDVARSLGNVNDPRLFYRNLDHKILPEIEHKFFMDSWKGMFLTDAFKEADRNRVVLQLQGLREQA